MIYKGIVQVNHCTQINKISVWRFYKFLHLVVDVGFPLQVAIKHNAQKLLSKFLPYDTYYWLLVEGRSASFSGEDEKL